MFDLSGKVALVAGAGYFGVPIGEALRSQGSSIVFADVDESRISAAVSAIPQGDTVRAGGLRMDISDEASIIRAVREAFEMFGQLDILINATYRSVGKRVEDLSADEFDAMLHVNVTGSFLLAREAAAKMTDGGSIVLFSSMYGRIAPDPRIYDPPLNPNPIEYGVAKAGLEQMTRYLAVHWAPRKIRVNAIAPGAFPHEHQRSRYPEWMKRLAEKAPLARLGSREEIVGAAIYLVSDEASFVTGQVLAVDGGWTIW